MDLYLNHIAIRPKFAKKPSMNRRGSEWIKMDMTINGKPFTGYMDQKYSSCVYIEYNKRWYQFDMHMQYYDENESKCVYVDLSKHLPLQFTTKKSNVMQVQNITNINSELFKRISGSLTF